MSPVGSSGAGKRTVFYGWYLVAIAWVLYGLQVAGFYSWGFYLPETTKDLGMSRAGGGIILGVATFCAGAVAPLVGMSITRFGLRAVMTAGFALSALGYFATSQAKSFWHLLLVYGIFTAGTHAFATIVPTQTLASIWFVRYRARVLAILLASGGPFALVIYWANAKLLSVSTWRTGWVLIGVLNLVLAAIAIAFVRDSPESIGQRPDGDRPTPKESSDELAAAARVVGAAPAAAATTTAPANAAPTPALSEGFTTSQAVRTPQFFLMILSGLAYSVPWSVLNNHSRFHLQDIGFELEAAAAILSAMVLVSTFGRLSGALGDFLSPPRILAVALTLEGIGCGLFLIASTKLLAYTAVILIGLGFGTAYITQAATFAQFFGRRAFATTTGIRMSIGAVFSAFAPGLAGWLYDVNGTYVLPFVGLMVLSLVGAAVAFTIRAPQAPAPVARLAAVAIGIAPLPSISRVQR